MTAPALPTIFTPEQVAVHIGWSPRKLREFARGLGACRIMGNRMVLTQQDVDAILEASRPCPSPSTSAGTSGTTAEPLKGSDYAELLAVRSGQKQLANYSRSRTRSLPGSRSSGLARRG